MRINFIHTHYAPEHARHRRPVRPSARPRPQTRRARVCVRVHAYAMRMHASCMRLASYTAGILGHPL